MFSSRPIRWSAVVAPLVTLYTNFMPCYIFHNVQKAIYKGIICLETAKELQVEIQEGTRRVVSSAMLSITLNLL